MRAHIFLCMLAYYVEWHMREAWRELMFADEDLERPNHARSGRRRPSAPSAALEKVHTHITQRWHTGTQSRTLIAELATLVRNTCEARVGKSRGSTFEMTTTPNPAQHRALELLQAIAL